MGTKRLIFGDGKVSQLIRKPNDIIITHHQCDITDAEEVSWAIETHEPDVVINCAGKTSLEWCQDNKEMTYLVNTLGPINILESCKETDAKFVHISSGCLFDGNDIISYEDSIPTPSVWYTHTKAWADEYISSYGYENYLILRPRQLISSIPHPTNMITKFLSFKDFYGIEEQNSITCIEDFSDMIDHLVDNDEAGIFNCCNEDTLSPYEIACMIRDTLAHEMKVYAISYDDLLGRLPNRRVNTIQSTDKLRATGYEPRPATDALSWCLQHMKEHMEK